jgi:hypothetical protein
VLELVNELKKEGVTGARQRAEERGSDRSGGGEVVLSVDDPTDQGLGPPDVRVLGAV